MREKTNSITHLVKIVAEEVFEDLSITDYNRLSARILQKDLIKKEQ